MKEITFLTVAAHLGGAERSLLDLVSRLEAHSNGKYRPKVILPSEGPLRDELARTQVAHEICQMPPAFLQASRGNLSLSISKMIRASRDFRPYLLALRTLVSNGGPLVHTTGIKMHMLGALIARLSQKRVCWHMRDILDDGPVAKILRLEHRALRIPVVANSKATLDSIGPRGLDRVVYNGFDTEHLARQERGTVRARFGFGSDQPIIGIVGVLARWKGQFEFIKMAKKVVAARPDARFVLVGDQIYDTSGERGVRDELERLVAELGLQKHVFFWGFCEDVRPVISDFDVLVHGSIRPEPFGRVIVEGWALGTPVVASRAGGVLEIVEDGYSGLLYEPGSSEDMANKVKTLLDSKDLMRRLSENGGQEFRKRFSIGRHLDQMIQFFDEVIG